MTTTPTTTPAPVEEKVPGLRAFKGSPEVENFYRFVHENGLRREAHALLGTLVDAIKAKNKKSKKQKVQ